MATRKRIPRVKTTRIAPKVQPQKTERFLPKFSYPLEGMNQRMNSPRAKTISRLSRSPMKSLLRGLIFIESARSTQNESI
jgi:hypothetical protein